MNATPSSGNDVGKVERLKQHFGAFVASLGGFALGVSLGWSSSAGAILRNNLNATGSEIGIVGGILNAGACFGVVLVPFVDRYVSRISTMFFIMPIFAVGWTFVCFADQILTLFIIGRLICGACGGMFCILTPIYVAEIADKETRGRLLTFFHLLINCGIMYAFVIAYVLNEQKTVWRYSLICAITCLTIGLVNLLPESPLHYLSINDETSAVKSLKWYRGDAHMIQEEIRELKRLLVLSRSEKTTLEMIKNRSVLRSFAMSFAVIMSYQLCGVNTMILYAMTLFENVGSGEMTGSEQTLVVGAVQILSCLLSTVLVDVLGRRILLTISSALMGLFLILLGWFFSLRDADPENEDIYFWMPPTWIILFFSAFNLGVGPISWSLLGDVFPAEIKVPAAASAAGFGWLISLIATLTFDGMIVTLGVTKSMWLFAAFCWFAAIFCAIVVKDNRGKSLTEIQKDFGFVNLTPARSRAEET